MNNLKFVYNLINVGNDKITFFVLVKMYGISIVYIQI